MYEPFRAALLALREEFVRAVNRHPDVFFEELATPTRVDTLALALNMDSHELPDRMWAAFFKANETPENDDFCEWWVTDQSSRRRPGHTECRRLLGDSEGIEEFKRLAESLALVLNEFDLNTYEEGGFTDCLSAMRISAEHYPTPLLRLKNRTWGIPDESDFPQEALETIHQKLSLGEDNAPILNPNEREGQCEDDGLDSSLPLPSDVAYPYSELLSPGGEAPYPVHPSCRFLAHNVFTSAIAFIDAILDPDKALLVEGLFGLGYTPPISLVKADLRHREYGLAILGKSVEPPPSDSVASTKSPYAFRFDEGKQRWYLRFPGDDDDDFDDYVGLRMYAMLLREKDRPMSPIELRGTEAALLERAESQAGLDLTSEEKQEVQRGIDEELLREEESQFEPTITERDKRQYERQIQKYDQDIEAAKEEGALARVAELTASRDDLSRWLEKQLNFWGRPRTIRPGSPAEKARRSAKRAMQYALAAIRDTMPRLVAYLKTTCQSHPGEVDWCYRSEDSVDWEF